MRVGGFVHNAFRLGFAALAVVAMTYQFSALDNTLPSFSHGNFWSFFTIQSNILGAATLAAAAIVRRPERRTLFDVLRGAATLYMAITGVVFALLLSGLQEELDTHIAWVDFTVHKLMPVVLVVDWLLEPARKRLPLWTAGAWLAYPLAWLTYTLVRGASEDWYPYPFVDIESHGYGRVLLNAAVMAACFAVGAFIFLFVGNWRTGPIAATGESAPEAA